MEYHFSFTATDEKGGEYNASAEATSQKEAEKKLAQFATWKSILLTGVNDDYKTGVRFDLEMPYGTESKDGFKQTLNVTVMAKDGAEALEKAETITGKKGFAVRMIDIVEETNDLSFSLIIEKKENDDFWYFNVSLNASSIEEAIKKAEEVSGFSDFRVSTISEFYPKDTSYKDETLADYSIEARHTKYSMDGDATTSINIYAASEEDAIHKAKSYLPNAEGYKLSSVWPFRRYGGKSDKKVGEKA